MNKSRMLRAAIWGAAMAVACVGQAQTNKAPQFGAPVPAVNDTPAGSMIPVAQGTPAGSPADGAEVVLISGYEASSGAPGGTRVKVTLDRPGKKVFLVLATYERILWEVVPTSGTTITSIIVSTRGDPAVMMVKAAPAYSMQLGYTYEPGRPTFIRMQEELNKRFGIRKIDMVRVRYTLPRDILIAQVDPPTVEATLTPPKVERPPRVMEFDLYKNDFSTVRWRLDGPLGTDAAARGAVYAGEAKVAFLPGGSTAYAIKSHSLFMLDRRANTETLVQLPPNFPELSWPMDVAYDSKRGLISVITLGGEGFFYRYNAKTRQWLDFRSVDNIDVSTLVYDPKSDRYAAWTSENTLLIISGDATPVSNTRLADALPEYKRMFSSGGGGIGRMFSLAMDGDDVALINISGSAVRAIWHYNLATKRGTLTYSNKQ